jgi:hypothetical protein
MFKLVYICFLFLQYYEFSKEFLNNVYFIENPRTKFHTSRLNLLFRQLQQLQWSLNEKDVTPCILLYLVKTRHILIEQDIYFLTKIILLQDLFYYKRHFVTTGIYLPKQLLS